MTAIILPWPAKALSPNARAHYQAKARAAKSARSDGFYATKAARFAVAAGDVPVLLDILCEPPTRRNRDYDNMLAHLKCHLDGIADALGVNDSLFRPTLRIGEPVKGGRVTVRLL